MEPKIALKSLFINFKRWLKDWFADYKIPH